VNCQVIAREEDLVTFSVSKLVIIELQNFFQVQQGSAFMNENVFIIV